MITTMLTQYIVMTAVVEITVLQYPVMICTNLLLMMTVLTCQRMAREEQRITAWMSEGSAGRATPDEQYF